MRAFVWGSRCVHWLGPLQDQIGLFDGMDAGDRVRVLFSMMGRQVPVELGERELVAA